MISSIKNREGFINFKKKLMKKKIHFMYKNEDINNQKIIPIHIKEQIQKKVKISILEKDNKYITILSIEKNLESYDGIYVKLVNFNSTNKLETEQLNCNYLNSLDNKIIFKEYEYTKLNKQIKNNLKSVNDFLITENDDVFNYIFLCELRFDEKKLNALDFNKKINLLASDITINFVRKYKKQFDFIKVQ